MSFGKIDNDNSKTIEFAELCAFFGYTETGALASDYASESEPESILSMHDADQSHVDSVESGA